MARFSRFAGYPLVYMPNKPSKDMRRLISVSIVAVIILSSCASQNKSYYETREGKRKLKYYNALQFGQKDVSRPKF